MPWGDRTGPRGFGPMTGRGAGYCAGNSGPGYMNPGIGFGRGFGFGRGRGMSRGFGRGFGFGRGNYQEPYPADTPYQPAPYYGVPYKQPSKEEEQIYLKDVVKSLEDELKAVRERLAELSKK